MQQSFNALDDYLLGNSKADPLRSADKFSSPIGVGGGFSPIGKAP
jgi:hypothetical protein